MSKLLAAIFAAMFALGSVASFAADAKKDEPKKEAKKDEAKKDDKKKDEEGGQKKSDKPAPKKLATCS